MPNEVANHSGWFNWWLYVGVCAAVPLTGVIANTPVDIGTVNTPAGPVIVVPPGSGEAKFSASDVDIVAYNYHGQQVQIQLPKDNQGGPAAAIFVSPYGTAAGEDVDQDGIVDGKEVELAEKFAPIIIHDKDDSNLPTNVDWLLRRTAGLEYYNNNGLLHKDDHIPRATPPLVQADLLGKSGSYDGNRIVRSDGTRSATRQHTFALLDVPDGDRQGSLSTPDWKTYVHAFRNYYGGISIQYWRCYAYNTGDQTARSPFQFDHHGGDWEAVTVILGKDLRPVQYRLLGHRDIDSSLPSDVSAEGDHVKIYSEPGGHSSHSNFVIGQTLTVAGIQYHIWLNDLTRDSNVIRQETWSNGTVLWPSETWRSHPGGKITQSGGLVNMGEKSHPLNGQVFLKYSGLWGSLGFEFSGYWGPAYNETKMAEGLITAWCYGMKASQGNVNQLHSECYPDEVSE